MSYLYNVTVKNVYESKFKNIRMIYLELCEQEIETILDMRGKWLKALRVRYDMAKSDVFLCFWHMDFHTFLES